MSAVGNRVDCAYVPTAVQQYRLHSSIDCWAAQMSHCLSWCVVWDGARCQHFEHDSPHRDVVF